MEKIKTLLIASVSALMSWLGILAIPVFLLLGCNLVDYFTGICAANYRNENVSSYKGMKGIIKKICMWLLVLVGAMMDTLINYAAEVAGLAVTLPFVVATVAAVWLICNEILSILENMIDIGMEESIPPFMLPLVKKIKQQVEERTTGEKKEK